MTRNGVTDEQYRKLHRRTREVERRIEEGTLPFDVSMERLQRVIEDEDEDRPVPEDRHWTVTVEYAKPIEELIRGITKTYRVEHVSMYLTGKYFPCRPGIASATLDLKFVDFKRPVPLRETAERLARYRYRPVTVHEMVAFSERYNSLVHYYPLVALGSPYRDPSHQMFAPWIFHGANSWCFDLAAIGPFALGRYLVAHA